MTRPAPPGDFAAFCAQPTLTALPPDFPTRATLRPPSMRAEAPASRGRSRPDAEEVETPASRGDERRARGAPPSSRRPASGEHPLTPSVRHTLPSLPPILLNAPPLGDDAAALDAGAPERGELTVIGTLGEGGMGRVLLVHQRSLARDVAVKVMKPQADAERAAAALLAEARVMGHLEHPGIVPVHALGRGEDGSPVLVMKRIDGVPWSTLLAEPAHPAWRGKADAHGDRALMHLEILVQLCNAVHFAHRRGVVHRDLKPENVMIGEFGEVYLTDWGIALPLVAGEAASTDEAPIVGTPAYMAPEMVCTDLGPIDARTDVYLLGAILHEIIAGCPRNGGETLAATLWSAAHASPAVYGPEVAPELAAIATKATARHAEDRFPSAQAFARALSEHLRHRGAHAIAQAAHRKLAEVEAALSIALDARSPEAARALSRASTECRFGFLEALRSHPNNESALAGLARHDRLMLSEAIARDDPAGARRVLDEMDAPPESARRQVAAIEEKHRERSAEVASLQKLAQDLDPGVAARERTFLIGLILILGAIAIPVAAFSMSNTHAGMIRRLTRTPLAMMALGAVAVAAMGKTARKSAFNRRIVGLYFLALGMTFLHRLAGFTSGEAQQPVLRGDLMIFATLLIGAGITTMRRVAWAATPFLAAAMLFPNDERLELWVFGAAVTSAMLIVLFVSHTAGAQK
jgi:hypothetical protein